MPVEDEGDGNVGSKKASAKAGLGSSGVSRGISITAGERFPPAYRQTEGLSELDVIRNTDTASTEISVFLAFSVIDPDRCLHFPLNQRILLGLIFRHDVQHATCRYECLHFISPYLMSPYASIRV